MKPFRPPAGLLLIGLWTIVVGTAPAQTPDPSCPPNPLGVVFVANGSGDSRSVTDNLWVALSWTGVPLQVQTIPWCVAGTVAGDHMDAKAQLCGAARLAREVAAYRAACPDKKIYLMGHSAGTHVVLAAAALLPPGAVDRIVVLAPSVSCCYDLRPALCCAREGIDCYYSYFDMEVAIGVEILKTADRKKAAGAGENGFACLAPCHPDAYLYSKLHQFGWTPLVRWTGHRGGHYGATEPGFLSAYVLPTMLSGH